MDLKLKQNLNWFKIGNKMKKIDERNRSKNEGKFLNLNLV